MSAEQVGPHPMEAFVSAMEQLHVQYAEVPTWSLTPEDLADLTVRMEVLRRRGDAKYLQLVAQADRLSIGDPSGHANTPGWLAAVTRSTKPAAHHTVAVAHQLEREDHTATREALARGDISVDQAVVIMRSVDALPDDLVDPGLRELAEKDLVGFAEYHDPKQLRRLSRRILEVRAPEIADEAERRALEAEERHAAATASFTMRPDGHGSMVGRFKVPMLAGQILESHLNALAAPKHRAATGEQIEKAVARPLRWGTAFTEYLQTRDAAGMPRAGGVPATVVVTMTLESLLGGIQAASLDTGDRISAAEARRLACEAGIIAAVLGAQSQILDLGRKTRFHTEPQRIAIAHRDRTCRAEHCDWPPALCHVHHPEPWSHGGGTSVENGMLLCPRHHSLAHDSRYQLKSAKNGRVTFSRRT